MPKKRKIAEKEVEFCTFEWRDRGGNHRCDDWREHVTHVCCCGADMTTGSAPNAV